MCRRQAVAGQHDRRADRAQVLERVEQLELGLRLAREELDVLEHEEVAALAEAALEGRRVAAADAAQ